MLGGKSVDMEELSPDIPIDQTYYSEYTYDADEIADTARTEASSTHDYRYEHGRRYHAYREGSYPMPNDELNTQHERIAHHMFGIVLQDRLYLPPIKEPKNVIDLGTGQGLWAFDMAERYPETQILGLDLTPPPQSLYNNLQFQVDDITSEWIPNEGYDLAHIRLLFGAVQDWPSLYAKVFENLVPGGYIQHIEIEIKPRCDDATLPSPNTLEKWTALAHQLSSSSQHNFMMTESMAPSMRTAGFTSIHEERFKLPLGPWSSNPVYQDVGRYFELFWRTGCQGWVMAACTRDLGWTSDMVDEVVEEAVQMIERRECHAYYEMVAIWARKPEE